MRKEIIALDFDKKTVLEKVSFIGNFSDALTFSNNLIKEKKFPFVHVQKSGKLVAVLKLAAHKSEMLAPFTKEELEMM
jgi:hypothetical protein